MAYTTLTIHLLDQLPLRTEENEELLRLLLSIALATKIIGRVVAGWGINGAAEFLDSSSGAGELDRRAEEVLVETLAASGHFGLLVSERRDSVLATAVGQSSSQLVVAFDPLDGVSNLGSNIPVGTIFTILRKKNDNRPAVLDDFLQPGRNIVAAGYAVYGAQTSFVCSWGQGVHSYTLDPSIGDFVLTRERLMLPEHGRWYSVNEGYAPYWESPVSHFVDLLKQYKKGTGGGYMARYVGALVVDFDRNLKEGGVFLHPANKQRPQGKLRLVYECSPLAFLIEQAGGKATNGTMNVLDLMPSTVRDRCPFISGSLSEIAWYERCMAGEIVTG